MAPQRLAGQYGVSAGVDVTGVLAWSAKRKMARLYHADLAELAWARYDKVMALASMPCTDGQRPGAGAEEQLDNRPDPRAREAYAFFQHGAAELRGGSVNQPGSQAQSQTGKDSSTGVYKVNRQDKTRRLQLAGHAPAIVAQHTEKYTGSSQCAVWPQT